MQHAWLRLFLLALTGAFVVCIVEGAIAKPGRAADGAKVQPPPPGTVYVQDDFSNPARSNRLWAFASCSLSSPHGVENSDNRDKVAYPQIGQASRKGYCTFAQDGSGKFLRFITMPFDRRDAEPAGDNYLSSVDWRKGGSEIRPKRQLIYDGREVREGWDLDGRTYLNPSNTISYRWDFRLSDISMILPDEEGTKLAGVVVTGQFHSQTSPACNAGGPHTEGFSPAPGLSVRVLTEKKLSTQDKNYELLLTLATKLTNKQARDARLKDCGGADAKICDTTLWSQKFSLKEIASPALNAAGSAPWITVNYVMRPSKSNGTLQFFFGLNASKYPDLVRKTPELAYSQRQFTTKETTLTVPLTQNNCPNTPYIGSYVLGYPIKYYGYPSENNFVETQGSRPSSEQRENLIRGAQSNPSTWVHESFRRNYGRFIRGQQGPGELPPQFVVDYRSFQITQEKGLR